MRTYLTVVAGLLLVGCAAVPPSAQESAYYLDRERGLDQQHSWDLQVALPDAPYALRSPEGLGGVHAEEVMDVHNRTFGEKPEKVPVLTLGLTGD